MPVVLNVTLTLDPNNQIAHLADYTNLVVEQEYLISGAFLQADTRFHFLGYFDITLTRPPLNVPQAQTEIAATISTVPMPAAATPPAAYPFVTNDRLVFAGLNNALELSPGNSPPVGNGGTAHRWKQWIDTSVNPVPFRVCRVPTASAGYIPGEWATLFTLDTTTGATGFSGTFSGASTGTFSGSSTGTFNGNATGTFSGTSSGSFSGTINASGSFSGTVTGTSNTDVKAPNYVSINSPSGGDPRFLMNYSNGQPVLQYDIGYYWRLMPVGGDPASGTLYWTTAARNPAVEIRPNGDMIAGSYHGWDGNFDGSVNTQYVNASQSVTTKALTVNESATVSGNTQTTNLVVTNNATISGMGIKYSAASGPVFIGLSWENEGRGMYVYVDGVYRFMVATGSSDERLKTNIVPSDIDALSLLRQVDTVAFDMGGSHFQIGVRAQQLEGLLPDAVVKGPLDGDTPELLSVDLLPLTATLVKAVQQISDRLDKMERK